MREKKCVVYKNHEAHKHTSVSFGRRAPPPPSRAHSAVATGRGRPHCAHRGGRPSPPVRQERLLVHVLVLRRGLEPFGGRVALPYRRRSRRSEAPCAPHDARGWPAAPERHRDPRAPSHGREPRERTGPGDAQVQASDRGARRRACAKARRSVGHTKAPHSSPTGPTNDPTTGRPTLS